MNFRVCEKCGKRLIVDDEHIGYFRFGARDDEKNEPPVDMEIIGSVRIKCLNKKCKHVNILHFFPFPDKLNK